MALPHRDEWVRQVSGFSLTREVICTIEPEMAAGGGGCSFSVTEEEFAACSDPAELYAKKAGVRVEDVRAWLSEGCGVQCQHTTSKGRRCKKYITGKHLVSVTEWVALGGGYCATHEGW